MGKLVQGLGVLLAVSAAAVYFAGHGSPHAYDITFVTGKGGLQTTKAQSPPYLVNENQNKPTTWTFTNAAGADVEFEMYESSGCHFIFTPPQPNPTGNCGSKRITVGNKSKPITAHVDPRWNGTDCVSSTCPSIVSARILPTGIFKAVDPELQIERDSLVPQWLLVPLAALAALLFAIPPLVNYMRHRRMRGAN
jgi:hypothetical protein